MKPLLIDARWLLAGALCAAAGWGLKAFATPPQAPQGNAAQVSPANPEVKRWDFKCVHQDAAGVGQGWANGDLDKPTGWNPFIAKMVQSGWEPATFLMSGPNILAVCFRRPAG